MKEWLIDVLAWVTASFIVLFLLVFSLAIRIGIPVAIGVLIFNYVTKGSLW